MSNQTVSDQSNAERGSIISLQYHDPTGARRLKFWSCKVQYHINWMMSNRIQMIQRWLCNQCHQKPIADDDNNKKAPVLDKKKPGVHEPKLHILQWNANRIHRELPPLEDLWKLIMWTLCASNRQRCSQRTRLLISKTSVLSDMIDQFKGNNHFDQHSKTHSLQSQPITGKQLKHDGEAGHQDSTPNSHMFIICNWYLLPENSHYLQRIDISFSGFQPENKEHEMTCADVNAHETAWG